METHHRQSPSPLPAWRLALWLSIPALLAIPALAMLFTSEVAWGPGDFAIAAGLLVATALAMEIILRVGRSPAIRLVLAAGVFALLALAWVELAVGVFGTPFAGS